MPSATRNQVVTSMNRPATIATARGPRRLPGGSAVTGADTGTTRRQKDDIMADLNALLGKGSEFEGKLTFEGTV